MLREVTVAGLAEATRAWMLRGYDSCARCGSTFQPRVGTSADRYVFVVWIAAGGCEHLEPMTAPEAARRGLLRRR